MKLRSSSRQGNGAVVLSLLWVMLVVYASLYPFAGWRMPPGVDLPELLHLPWPRWIPGFDPAANLVGYVPMGWLLALALLDGSRSRWWALVLAIAGSAGLSYSMEVMQQFVPRRVPSAIDLTLNSAGAALGALLAAAVDVVGWRTRWRWMHDRWLGHGGSTVAALLVLWPLGLLFPSPLPFGLGQVGGRLRELALDALDGVSWALPLTDWLGSTEIFEPAPISTELTVAVLGLLAPSLLAYAASQPSWRRVWLSLGVPVLAAAVTSLSTALNFGPEHAFAWLTPGVTTAMALATALALLLVWIGPRLAAGLALVVLTGLVVLVHMAPPDPYFADSLQAWEQGAFIRFHGLAKWVGWLWPYAALAWLLSRLRVPD